MLYALLHGEYNINSVVDDCSALSQNKIKKFNLRSNNSNHHWQEVRREESPPLEHMISEVLIIPVDCIISSRVQPTIFLAL